MRTSTVAAGLLLALVMPLYAVQPLNTGQTAHFSGSGHCSMCHTGSGAAMMEDGQDISPITHWRSTMMANSARDPLWRATVSAEVAAHPALQDVIEDKCTTCHAPMGHAEASFNGALPYSIAEMEADPVAADGVSCTLCHQILPDNLGEPESFTGGYRIGADRQIFGPYANPLAMPMVNHTGFTPVAADHLGDSGLCATCHTLFTPYVDDQGQVVGEFPEQVPYLEWEASDFAAAGVSCQDCHMPQSQAPVDISTMPPSHVLARSPYWQHWFVGGNAFMLRMLRDNADSLALSATTAQFDATIERTMSNLTENSAMLDVQWGDVDGELEVAVKVVNATGHKLPTGIPLRRMWIHLTAFDHTGQVVFESGGWDGSGRIAGLDAGYEPHHELITDSGQVQVYEGIMADVNGAPTYTLLRAGSFLKDNRLPPMGMSSADSGYATIAVAGAATSDPDFNRDGAVEGTGADIVRYRPGPAARVTVDVCFQSVNPAFTDHLAAFDTPEVATFLGMYDGADNSPVIMASAEVFTDPTAAPDATPAPAVRLDSPWPNPFNPAANLSFALPADGHVRVAVYDLLGHRVDVLLDEMRPAGEHRLTWQPRNLPSGVYVLRLDALGRTVTRKLNLVE
jgi:hypothetical protein